MDIRILEELENESLTLEELKVHLKIEHDLEDDYLNSLLKAAIDFCENYTKRYIYKKRIEFLLTLFPPGLIKFNAFPIQEITKISYLDAEEQLKTIDSGVYQAVLEVEPPVIISNIPWPSDILNLPASIRIEAIVGYEDIPKSIKQAIFLLCGHFYENREVMRERYVNGNEIPFSVTALLYPYKVLRW